MTDDCPLPAAQAHPYIRRISFLLTERCPARCGHCVYALGPGVPRRADMAVADVCDWLEQAVAAGVGEFCFTGGEPFVAYSTLQPAAEHAARLGARAGAITNAFWAVNPDTARLMLEPLATLQELSISADRYHQQYIPFERVRHAVSAARALGIPPRVKIAYLHWDEVVALQFALSDILAPDEVDADPIRHVGRMVEQPVPPPALPPAHESMGCPSTRSLMVVPGGRVAACCGPIVNLAHDHPLWLGDLRAKPVAEILADMELNTIYQFIRLRGPHALYRLLAGAPGDLPLDTSSPCSLCHGLLSAGPACDQVRALGGDDALARSLAIERLLFYGEARMLACLPARVARQKEHVS